MIASLVQLITPNDMRGRVMSVYNVAFRGGMPFGSIFTGWLVPLLTAPTVLTINGIACYRWDSISCWCSGAWLNSSSFGTETCNVRIGLETYPCELFRSLLILILFDCRG